MATQQLAASYWRVAGLNYLQYVGISANVSLLLLYKNIWEDF